MGKEIYNWNRHEGPAAPVRPPNLSVEIDNETWRDGLQGTQVSQHPSIEGVSDYLVQTAQLRYSDHFDIGYPGSSGHKPRVIELINFSKTKKLELTHSAAGRGAAIDDAKAIIEVSQATGFPLEADLFLDVSTTRAKSEKWDRATMIRRLKENIALVRGEGLPVMFVPERASVTNPEELFEVCTIAADLGVDRIGIADTTGVLSPIGTAQIFREAFERIGRGYPEIKFDFHEHGDLGMGIANCIVAASEGVDRLHATSRGIGERVGNVPLEQLLVVLSLQGFREVDTKQIQKYARMAADLLSVPIGDHEPIIGRESASTASGIHARGYEKDHDTYSPFPGGPEYVGLRPSVKIGPMSSLANVYEYCRGLEIEIPTEEKAIEVLAYAKERWGLLSADDVKKVLGRNGANLANRHF